MADPSPAPANGKMARLVKLATSPALFAYGAKAANAVAAFAATAILARVAGPAVIGNYSFAVVTATLFGIIASQGLDITILRVIAGDLRLGNSGAARGVLRYSLIAVAVVTLVITLGFAAAVATGRVAEWLETDQQAMLAAIIGIGSVAFFRLGLAGLRAVGRPVAGQFYEGLGSFIFVTLVAGLWYGAKPVSAALAVLMFFACQLTAVIIIWIIIRRDARHWDAAIDPDRLSLSRQGVPIMAIQGTLMFQDWLLFALVGGAASAAAVGALRVAMQVVLAIGVVVATGETYIAAKVAGDIRAGRPDLVWRRHRRATLAMALATGPLVLVCILFPAPLLGYAFGPAFAIAGPALAIMAAGQATKLVTGPIGGLLTMSGHQNWLLRFTIVGLALQVGLALWLVPLLGLEGAAIAQAVSAAFRNVAAYVAAWVLIPKMPEAEAS